MPRHWPQTSMAGDHVGLMLVGLGAEAGTTAKAVGDCLTIVRDSKKEIEERQFWKKPYAEVWKDLKKNRIKIVAEKVPAHMTLKRATAEGWTQSWWGNARADTLARLAAIRYETNKATVAEVVSRRSWAKQLLQLETKAAILFQEKQLRRTRFG